jgi:outer membrane autotransporter protein
MVVLYAPPPLEAASKSGFTFGARLGVGFPGGQLLAASTTQMTSGEASDLFGVLIPVTLELGYRITPHWYVGLYGSVGYATATNCSTNGTDAGDCSETDYRFGVDVEYAFRPEQVWQPWVGVGAGWEVTNQFQTDLSGDESTGSLNGVELAHVNVGNDWRISPRDKLGVYGLVTFDTYDNGYVHEWYMVGIRWRHDTNWLYR